MSSVAIESHTKTGPFLLKLSKLIDIPRSNKGLLSFRYFSTFQDYNRFYDDISKKS